MTCAVIDVGKSYAKLALVDASGCIVAGRRTASPWRNNGPYPHADVDGLFDWIQCGLDDLDARFPVDRIICTTHGAAAALLSGNRLALPVMDYEWSGMAEIESDYRHVRDPFAETLSPSLPCGLNLGRQIYWQATRWPAAYAEADCLLTYPQFWAWRLCGARASEVSSLGSHTDLWRPLAAAPSALAVHLGANRRLPPLRPAGDVLGEWQGRPPGGRRFADVAVHCGVHDSSAAYMALCPDPGAPATVVSTGTWIVCMTPLRDPTRLDSRRDCSGTVGALGAPLACSRFMGGREFSCLAGTEGLREISTEEDLLSVIDAGTFAIPAFAEGGPFGRSRGGGRVLGPAPDTAARKAALAALYCALITDECLDLIGARGPIVVDGPFADNKAFLAVLSGLRADDPVAASECTAGATRGAARLAYGDQWSAGTGEPTPASSWCPQAVREYRDHWRVRVHAETAR